MTEPRPDPRRLAYDAAVACLAADPEIPRDLVTRNAVAWRAVHAALDAILGRTTPDNPAASGDRADNSSPPDGPTVAEAAADDLAHWPQREWEDTSHE